MSALAYAFESEYELQRAQRTDPVRLFCVPHAGGSTALYRRWARRISEFAEVVPVELPGRGCRASETPISRMEPLIENLVACVAPHVDQPFSLFGHSMGSLICFEMARVLRKRHGVEPDHLFVSAFGAPHVHKSVSKLHKASDAKLLRQMKAWGSIPRRLIENPMVRNMLPRMLPVLRADLEVAETYAYRLDAPLSCPITVLAGLSDSMWEIEHYEAWREQTRGRFDLQMFKGGHFFLEAQRLRVLETLGRKLGANARATAVAACPTER